MFYSQEGQDIYVNGLFDGKRNGVFVEFGAFDGVQFSNTLFFEKHKEWTGLCVEPDIKNYSELVKNRSCKTLNMAVYDHNGVVEFSENPDNMFMSGIEDNFRAVHKEGVKNKYLVPCIDINTLLEEYGLYEIDFMSVDTEGSEADILGKLDFSRFHVKCFCVEGNDYGILRVGKLMNSNGYSLISKLGMDTIYFKDDSGIVPFKTYTQVITKIKFSDGNEIIV